MPPTIHSLGYQTHTDQFKSALKGQSVSVEDFLTLLQKGERDAPQPGSWLRFIHSHVRLYDINFRDNVHIKPLLSWMFELHNQYDSYQNAYGMKKIPGMADDDREVKACVREVKRVLIHVLRVFYAAAGDNVATMYVEAARFRKFWEQWTQFIMGVVDCITEAQKLQELVEFVSKCFCRYYYTVANDKHEMMLKHCFDHEVNFWVFCKRFVAEFHQLVLTEQVMEGLIVNKTALFEQFVQPLLSGSVGVHVFYTLLVDDEWSEHFWKNVVEAIKGKMSARDFRPSFLAVINWCHQSRECNSGFHNFATFLEQFCAAMGVSAAVARLDGLVPTVCPTDSSSTESSSDSDSTEFSEESDESFVDVMDAPVLPAVEPVATRARKGTKRKMN